MSSSWAGEWQILYVLQKDPYNIYYHITHTIYWRVYLFIYLFLIFKQSSLSLLCDDFTFVCHNTCFTATVNVQLKNKDSNQFGRSTVIMETCDDSNFGRQNSL